MRVAFIGLGAMGFPMAGHIAAHGFEVNVFNRSQTKAQAWVERHKGAEFPTPRLAVSGCDVVCICVGNDDDVRSVVYGDEGILAGLNKGALVIDHTTTSANLAKELHENFAAAEINFLDAPVSGGQAGAEHGKLTTMVGGNEQVYLKACPVLDCYSQKHQLMGKVGAGQTTKMVNQICIAGVLQGLSEALHFAVNAGLDTKSVVDVISKGAAQSWQMDNRAHTMVKGEFDFGFAVDWMRKDLKIVLEEANNNKSILPLTAMVDQFYAQVQNKGGGRLDTSSLISLLNDTK